MSEQAAVAAPEVATTLLEIQGLNAFYGSAQALEDVTFSMGRESIAIVGRNGMGKTTLCNAIMGFSPPRTTGSIRFDGDELVGVPSHRIARRGLGYVPQGRRLFPSLTVDEPAPADRFPRRTHGRKQRVDARARLRALPTSR
jgi:branched-chain amino acid transport system ATP-binding protein